MNSHSGQFNSGHLGQVVFIAGSMVHVVECEWVRVNVMLFDIANYFTLFPCHISIPILSGNGNQAGGSGEIVVEHKM